MPAPLMSFLVPYRSDPASPQRRHTWSWLRAFWAFELPEAQIIVCDSDTEVFSKTQAVNKAASKADGEIFVILDADAYMRGWIINQCAQNIHNALASWRPLWYIPYRNLYRLTRETSEMITSINPMFATDIPSPPPDFMVESMLGSMHGRRFGAMIQIMPRQAFELIGGMDERFVGWGGEDVAFVRALDTLYVNHKTTNNDILHLWHANKGTNVKDRMWAGQETFNPNSNLAQRYNQATGDVDAMRALVDEAR